MLETMETNIENACDNHTSKYQHCQNSDLRYVDAVKTEKQWPQRTTLNYSIFNNFRTARSVANSYHLGTWFKVALPLHKVPVEVAVIAQCLNLLSSFFRSDQLCRRLNLGLKTLLILPYLRNAYLHKIYTYKVIYWNVILKITHVPAPSYTLWAMLALCTITSQDKHSTCFLLRCPIATDRCSTKYLLQG